MRSSANTPHFKKHIPRTFLSLSILIIASSILVIFDILDPDLFWHMANGRIMMQTGQVVNEEIFSYTAYGTYFSNHQWLAEILLFLFYDKGGVAGLFLIKILIAITISSLLFYSAINQGLSPQLAALLSFFSMTVVVRRLLVRPELFSLLGLALLAFILFSYRSKGVSYKTLFAIPVIMLFWDFLHGAIYGLVFLAAFYTGETIKYYLDHKLPAGLKHNPPSRDQIRWLWIIAAITIIVMIISPYGLRSYDLFYHLIYGNDFKLNSSELQPTPLMIEFIPFWIYIFITFLILLLIRHKLDITEILVYLPFAYLSLKYLRGTGPFALAVFPILSGAIKRLPETWPPPLLKKRGIAILTTTALFCFIHIKFVASHDFISFGYRLSDRFNATGATRFIKEINPSGNMYNNPHSAGILAYFLHPDKKIFHYNHHMVFRSFTDYYRNPGLLDKFDFNFAVIRDKWELDYFNLGKWALVYRDPAATVLVERNVQNKEIIDYYEIRYFSPFLKGSELIKMAKNPSVSSQILKEISIYLSFKHDRRIANLLGDILDRHIDKPASPVLLKLLRQTTTYNSDSKQLVRALQKV